MLHGGHIFWYLLAFDCQIGYPGSLLLDSLNDLVVIDLKKSSHDNKPISSIGHILKNRTVLQFQLLQLIDCANDHKRRRKTTHIKQSIIYDHNNIERLYIEIQNNQ